MFKTFQIVLALLGCSLAALPVEARPVGAPPPCDKVVYSWGSVSVGPAQQYQNMVDQAGKNCLNLWPSLSAYQNAQCEVRLSLPYLVNNITVYNYECLKCKDARWSWPIESLDPREAIGHALEWRPGSRPIGVTIGERETADGLFHSTYHVSLLEGDLILGVDVDAETGEVLTPQNADPSEP